MRKLLVFCICFMSAFAYSIPSDHGVDYDIIYVRYPIVNNDGSPYVSIPQGERPYRILPGADLVRLNPDGTTEVIIDCTDCSVMDPYVSYDGTTVYYSKILNISTASSPSWSANPKHAPGYIYKVDVSGSAPYTEVQLTFPGDFDSSKYANNDTTADDLGECVTFKGCANIRDMAPVPLADGRVLFTSNRAAQIGFNMGSDFFDRQVQQMYVIDDHDGTRNTPELSNLRRIEESTMSLAQHPMQLKDGRILYSTWVDFGNKYNYAMTELFTMHPDGSNVQQFTEPHDHSKNVNHFITQLSNEDIVVGWYYNSFDFGYGKLIRYDVSPHNGQFLRDGYPEVSGAWNNPNGPVSQREFDRPNSDNIWSLTPHAEHRDIPSRDIYSDPDLVSYGADRQGKYAYPSWGKYGDMLVSYSQGYVNHFDSACAVTCDDTKASNPPACSGFSNGHRFGQSVPYPNGSRCEGLKAGIYLIKDAETGVVTDPTDSAELAVLHDDVNYNEIWPRALVPYSEVFGQSTPDILPNTRKEASSAYVAKGEAAAIIGTSSMLNRESDHSGAFSNNAQRELHGGEWTKQGTDVGVFTDSDVYGVRILSIPEKIYTEVLNSSSNATTPYTENASNTREPQRFASTTNESWEVLGEFPLTNKAVTDQQGNPDTSWWAKIPAETPTTIQAIDQNGMTLYSETVWRSMAPGEQRTDCGGCHAHSTETTPLDFDSTEAGKLAAITNVSGLSDSDPMINQTFWDLSGDRVPVIADGGGVEIKTGGSWDIEYHRDIKPIFVDNCNSCHTTGGNNGGLILDDGNEWLTLAKGYTNNPPQVSDYIRSPQARMSPLVWVAWGSRLDGRTNGTRAGDIDYPDAHPALSLTWAEKRDIATWVDLGAPTNFPNTDTVGFGYEDDNQLPTVHIYSPITLNAPINQKIRIGINDAQSGVDWTSLSVTYYDVTTPGTVIPITTFNRDELGIITSSMPALSQGNDYVLTVTVSDVAGNTETATSRFTAAAAQTLPATPTSVSVSVQ